MSPKHPVVRSVIVAVGASAAAAGCDYTGDFLFSDPVIDDIRVFTDADGELLVPADIASMDDVAANTMYAEIGRAQTSAYGGATIDFVGTGGEVCLWVDPETVSWSQAIAARVAEAGQKWTYPDNVFDDGDIDMFAGLSVYYTGSPGEEIGDFVVSYEDSLGNKVPISLASCPNKRALQYTPQELYSSGRGSPEYCTIPTTDAGITYTVLLRTWTTPLDDDRMSFGFLLANGSCDALRSLPGPVSELGDECLIQGESLTPVGEDAGPFFGFDEINSQGRIWEGSVDFELQYCDANTFMTDVCADEFEAHAEDGASCSWMAAPGDGTRCYCGNVLDTPTGGAF